MAFPSDSYAKSDLASMIATLWIPRANDFFKQKQVASNFFLDLSSELTEGGDTLKWTTLTEMGANTKSNGAAVTLNSPAETNITLTVDTWKEVSFNIEDKEKVQVMKSYMLQERLAKNAAYTTSNVLEDAILALVSTFTNSVGASTTDIADSEIRGAIALLDAANAPYEERAFFFHPDIFWKQIYSLDRFVSRDYTDTSIVDNGYQGMLYGIKVYLSTRMPTISGGNGRYGILAHKDAIAFATHALPGGSRMRMQANYIPEYLSTLVTADILFGTVVNRQDSAVKILTKK